MPNVHYQYVYSTWMSAPANPGPFVTFFEEPAVPTPANQPYTVLPPNQAAPIVQGFQSVLQSSIVSGADIAVQAGPIPAVPVPYQININQADIFITYLYMPTGAVVGNAPTPSPGAPFALVCVYDEASGRFLSNVSAFAVTGFPSSAQNATQSANANASGYVTTADNSVTVTARGTLGLGSQTRTFDRWWPVPPSYPTNPPAGTVQTVDKGHELEFLAMYSLTPKGSSPNANLLRQLAVPIDTFIMQMMEATGLSLTQVMVLLLEGKLTAEPFRPGPVPVAIKQSAQAAGAALLQLVAAFDENYRSVVEGIATEILLLQ
jgi:hypothetical protein